MLRLSALGLSWCSYSRFWRAWVICRLCHRINFQASFERWSFQCAIDLGLRGRSSTRVV